MLTLSSLALPKEAMMNSFRHRQALGTPFILGALSVLVPGTETQAQWRGYGYSGGFGATSISAQINAEANYVQALGENIKNEAEAREIRARAVRQEIANSV